MSKRLQFLFGGIFFFLFFICFSYLVHKDVLKQFDFNQTVRLQDHISRRFDPSFSLLSEIGKFEVMSLVLIVILVLRRKIIAGLLAIGFFIGFHVIELYGKFFVDHTPPPEFLLRTKHMVDFPQFHVRTENSYPSGHAGRAAFISTILIALIWQSRLSSSAKIALTSIIIFYNVLMEISRIYLGEHWATDVIGGSILGLGLGLLASVLLVGKGKAIQFHSLKIPKYKLEIKKVE